MSTLSIAVSCHTPCWHESLDALQEVVETRISDARSALVIFPEYAAMEAALIGPAAPAPDWLERGAAAHERWITILRQAATRERCHILAGSGPVSEGGRILNRAVLIAPDGRMAHQDKLIPTPWERRMKISGGAGLKLLETSIGRIGISICYDAEFSTFARALAAAGADLILVPACTDNQAGQDRVRIASRARALENQCLVVHAPLIGDVPDCEIIDQNIGVPGFFGPPDHDQPDGGVHAPNPSDASGWCRAEIDLDGIKQTRRSGAARIFADWPNQTVPDLPVEVVVLGK